MSGGTAISSVESIPRDYHRRVLKKIAQLTKVVYALNTRNEEQECLVTELRSLYEDRATEAESRSAAALREMREKVNVVCEEEKRKMVLEKQQLEEEREQLKKKEVSLKIETDRQLNKIKVEHKEKVEAVARELEQVTLQQAQQLKDIEELRSISNANWKRREKELTDEHKRELNNAKETWKREIEGYQMKMAIAESEAGKRLEELKTRYRSELESMKLSVEAKKQAEEDERWKEKERVLLEERRIKEEEMVRAISALKQKLKEVNDQMLTAKQELEEMKIKIDSSSNGARVLQKQLEKTITEKESLQAELRFTQTRLQMAEEDREKLQKIISEKDRYAVTADERHREIVSELDLKLMALQEKVQELEKEKKILAIQHQSSVQKQSNSLSSIEREVHRLQREKDELRLQYAREIEAAHAQIGSREEELLALHSAQFQEMQQLHKNELEEQKMRNKEFLEQLERDLKSKAGEESQLLCDKHREEIRTLQNLLEEKDTRLSELMSELASLQTTLTERGRGLGEAGEEIERLKSEHRAMVHLQTSSDEEIKKLKEMVGRLRDEIGNGRERHKKELEEVRNQVLRETQTKCAELKWSELDGLRSELLATHSKRLNQALAALTQEKDSVLSAARQTWERERSSLREQIIVLEKKIMELNVSTSERLKENQSQAEEKISQLRDLLESERQRSKEEMVALERSCDQRLLRVRDEEKEKSRVEIVRLREQWLVEANQIEANHNMEMKLMMEEAEKEMKEEGKRQEEKHCNEIALLSSELQQQHEVKIDRFKKDLEKEKEKWTKHLHQLQLQREKEAADHQRELEETRRVAQRASDDLSTTKLTVHSLREEVSLLRRELEMRSRELESTRREAANILRCREQELSAVHHAEVETLTSQYSQQSQLMLANFNKTKKSMSIEIGQLQRRVGELEDLYQSRESRPEDVERIRELMGQVKKLQIRLKELEAEKQVYQLELVNREKNYNKIFNASPCVGVLDPLASSKKVSKEQASRHLSAPALTDHHLPSLVNSSSRLTASDVDLSSGCGQITRPRPKPAQSPLVIRRTRDKVH